MLLSNPPHRRHPLALALAAALVALCASPLAAQTPPPAADSAPIDRLAVAPVQQVTIEGERAADAFSAQTTSLTKLPADLHDVPQSVTVLNKALLQTQGATSLADALRNVPGITLGGAEGGQIGNNINLNGFTARTDIYLDGFRDRGQYYRDTFALDSVEVLMGPSSMLFGRGSTGGVINQVSKKPSLDAFDEVSASATTNGLVRATVDHNQPLGETTAVRIAAMAQDGAPTTRDEMKNRDYGVAPSLRLGIGTPTEITLSALLQHNRDMPDYGVSPLNGRPVAVDRDAFYGFTDDRLVQDVAALNASISHRVSPTVLLRNQTQFNQVRIDARETASNTLGLVGANGFTPLSPAATSSLPLDQLSVRLQSHDRVITDRSLFNQTELTAQLDTGGIRHQLLAGAELGRDTYVNQNSYRNGSCNGVPLNPATGTSGYVACEPLIDPAYVASPADVPDSLGNRVSSSATSVAAYVGDTASIGPQVKLVGGLRQDHFAARLSNSLNSANTPGNTNAPHIEQTVNFTSVRAGAIWQPLETLSHYLSYSTSFNPSLEQLTNTTGVTAPLPPTRNRAVEAGSKWDLAGGRLSLNGALFKITQYNARSQNSDGTYQATGTVRVQGARVGASGLLAKGWKVFGGYTWLDAEIVDGIAVGTQGKVPANTPKDAATLWTTYEFAPHWEVGGGAAYQSSRYLNNTNLVQVPGYARWDATLAWRQPAYDVRLNLFNLTDRFYYDGLITSDGGRAVPGSGRTGMVSLTYRF